MKYKCIVENWISKFEGLLTILQKLYKNYKMMKYKTLVD